MPTFPVAFMFHLQSWIIPSVPTLMWTFVRLLVSGEKYPKWKHQLEVVISHVLILILSVWTNPSLELLTALKTFWTLKKFTILNRTFLQYKLTNLKVPRKIFCLNYGWYLNLWLKLLLITTHNCVVIMLIILCLVITPPMIEC